MSLPPGFLDELKARVSIAEVIGKRVRLVRRGRQYLGLCPFHGEKTPSFHVWDDHYHCFGCGAHGSVLDFVMQADKVGFRDAVERVALLAGLTLPQATPEEVARDRRRGALVDVLEKAAEYYCRMLRMPGGKPALDYLRRRGLSDAALESWRLGYAPESGQAVKAALGREGIDETALLEAGLLVQPEDGARAPYDRFRGRVMFPISDRRGRIVGFGGRLLGQGEPKYLNSPETALFHKGRLLYGADKAAAAVQTAGTIIIVEGYMDVIGLAEAGWRNVVAPLGTALTEDQLRALWAMTAEPILLFDPDAAGERAALRAAERALPLLKPGLGLRMALLRVDTKDDPDRVAARWPKQLLHRTLQEAAPLSEFLFRVENKGRQHVPPEERAAVEDRLRQRAAAINDPGVRAHFQRAFRERSWQAMRVRRREFKGRAPAGGSRGGGAGFQAASGATPVSLFPTRSEGKGGGHAPLSSAARAELALCGLAVLHPSTIADHEEELGRLEFAEADRDAMRQALLMLHAMRPQMESEDVRAELATRGFASLLAQVLDEVGAARSSGAGADAHSDRAVHAAWRANLAVLRRQALKQELSDAAAINNLSAELWEQRRALIRAAMPVEDEDT